MILPARIRKVYLLIAGAVVCLAVDVSEAQWVSSIGNEDRLRQMERAQSKADQAFEEEKYWRARYLYTLLARGGDKFSQYRLAYIYEHGLGVEKDLAEAYAWSILAAELGDAALVEYRDRLEEQLEPGTAILGRERAKELLTRYNSPAIARRLIRENYHTIRTCTGSRIGGGNRCLDVRLTLTREIDELEQFVEEYWQDFGRVTIRDLEDMDDDVRDDNE